MPWQNLLRISRGHWYWPWHILNSYCKAQFFYKVLKHSLTMHLNIKLIEEIIENILQIVGKKASNVRHNMLFPQSELFFCQLFQMVWYLGTHFIEVLVWWWQTKLFSWPYCMHVYLRWYYKNEWCFIFLSAWMWINRHTCMKEYGICILP